MVRQFRFKVVGQLASGAHFATELLVLAVSEHDAEAEAASCLESFESVSDWSLTIDGSVGAEPEEERMYEERGTFAVFDPADLHERG